MTTDLSLPTPVALRDAAPLDAVAFALGAVRFHRCPRAGLRYGAAQVVPLVGPDEGCGACVVLGLDLPAGVSLLPHRWRAADAAIHVLSGKLVCGVGAMETVVAAGQVLALPRREPCVVQAVGGAVKALVRLAPARVPEFLAALTTAPELALAS